MALAKGTRGGADPQATAKKKREEARRKREERARERREHAKTQAARGKAMERGYEPVERARSEAVRRARASANLANLTLPEISPSDHKSTREDFRQAMVNVMLSKIQDDIAQSVASAPGARLSGEAILGPGLGPLLPIRGGQSAEEADLKWLPADVAGLFPLFRGPRLAATVGKEIAAGGRVSGVVAPGSRAASQYREPVVGPLVRRLRGRRAPGESYNPRTLRIGEREQQIPRARSRITQTLIEKPSDVVSRALDTEVVRAIPGLGRATASSRAAKAAGRQEAQEAIRASAAMGRHLKALKVGLRGKRTGTELAHTWWAQLPKSHRNVQGLKLIRAKLNEGLKEITSGQALREVERRQVAVRAEAATARKAGDQERVFDLMRESEELKILASDLPEQAKDISRSIAALDRVIAKPPKLNPAKIDALDALSQSRKETLIAEGVLDPARAAEREGLVSRWLGLKPTGEEIFFGHRLGEVSGANPSLLSRAVGTGRVKLPQGVSRENKLVLAKSGRTTQTFESAVRDWQAAQVFESTRRVRGVLGEMGQPFTGRVPKDSLLVNLRGRAVPKQWKAIEQLSDDLPEDEVLRAANEILSESFAQSGKAAEEMLEAAKKAGVSWDELRVVPKDIAERFFAQFMPAARGGKAMTAYDRLVDLTAASIVFARLGYIPKNVVQNVIMAVPHQGAFLLPNAVRAGQVLRDPQLGPLLRGEVGFSGATRALGKEARTQKVIGKVIGTVGGVADDPARISAFLHEAAAEGVISRAKPWLTPRDRDKLLRFLTDKNQRPLLNDVRSRGVEAMGDFSRMTPAQRRATRRVLIIPGWLMAGSRYPFHFAATHPVRSALMAYVAMGEPGAPERFQLNPPINQFFEKDLPHWAEGVGFRGKVWRTTSLSPANTPWDIGMALAQRSPETAGSFANPLAVSLWNIANRQVSGPEGSYRTGFGESVQRNLERLAPNVDLVRDLISPKESKYYPEDVTRGGRLKREIGVVPIEMAREEESLSAEEERVEEHRAYVKKWERYFKQHGEEMPAAHRRLIRARLAVKEAEEVRKRFHDIEKLTDYQRLEIRFAVAMDIHPQVAESRKEIEAFLERAKGNADLIRAGLNEVNGLVGYELRKPSDAGGDWDE